MTDDPLPEGPVEAQVYRSTLRLLVSHACWPVPPAAWGRLFVAGAALSELIEPAPSHPDGRMVGATLRLMVRILDQAYLDLEDHRQIRAFLPLVRGRSKSVDEALLLAAERLLDGGPGVVPDGAAELLEQIRTDATDQMLRGLTRGVGADQADEDRPDLASSLRNPYALADRVDEIRDLLMHRLTDLIREGGQDVRFMDRFAVLVPLAEASAELRGTKRVDPAELRIRKTDETLMRLLEEIGPDLVPEPVRAMVRPDPNLRRRGLPSRGPRGEAAPDNPYLGIRMIGIRSRAVGGSLDRLRDHLKSLLAEGGEPPASRGIPTPADPDALARTLRRIKAGA